MIFIYWLNFPEFLPNGKMFIAKMSQNPLFKRPFLGGMCENAGELSSSRQTISFIEKRTISC